MSKRNTLAAKAVRREERAARHRRRAEYQAAIVVGCLIRLAAGWQS